MRGLLRTRLSFPLLRRMKGTSRGLPAASLQAGVMSLLEKPSEWSNVDQEIDRRVEKLEHFVEVGQHHIDNASRQLDYALDVCGYGTRTGMTEKQRKLMWELCRSNKKQIRGAIRRSSQGDLMMILKYLEFRNQLDLNTFANIVMRLDLERLLIVSETMNRFDEHFLLKATIAVSSRYKMLGSDMLAQFMVGHNLESRWLPGVKAGILHSGAYLRNIVRLLKGLLPEEEIVRYVEDCRNPQFSYYLWEAFPGSYEARRVLGETLVHNEDSVQHTISLFAVNPLISTRNNYSRKLARISENLMIWKGSTTPRRLMGTLEVLINDLKDNVDLSDMENASLFESLVEVLDQKEHGTYYTPPIAVVDH